MNRVWYMGFTSPKTTTHPDDIRVKARKFANKVWMSHEENRIINITETIDFRWGTDITVWYEADREVAI